MLNWLSRLSRKMSAGDRREQDVSEYSVHPPGLTFLTDVSAGRWVEDGFSPRFSTLGALVPDGFEAHARVLHPALDDALEPVQWSTVAKWSGRVHHPLMSFEGISSPADGHGADGRPWLEDPNHGSMEEETATELAALLSRFTGTPQHCYFGVWEDYGQYSGGAAMLTSDGRGRPLGIPRDIRRAQRVRGVGRDYLLYAGRLEQITEFYSNFLSEPPNIWWPEDRAWFVATDIDLDSTYVGGNRECIAALLDDDMLEAVTAYPNASIAMTADTINLGNPT